jgi:ribonuclease HI
MPYKCEEELRQGAERFIKVLGEAGIDGAIIPGSARDYTLKVSIERGGHSFGHVNLYYSPKKDGFSMKTHELAEKAISPDLEACWERSFSLGQAAPIAKATATGCQIYVDGSCIDDAIGYGLVILKDDQIVAEFCGPLKDNVAQDMRQVGGELQAVYEAIAWCQANGVEEVTLFYDYAGIEKWATGEWQANKPATQAYAQSARNWPVIVHWRKVDSHSGNRWNDRADQLAKQGTTQGQIAPQQKQDPLDELGEKVTIFIEFLRQQEMIASFQGLVNNQFARILIGPGQGIVDVYNTPKRPLSRPYLHDFRDPAVQSKVESLWQASLLGGSVKRAQKDDILRGVSYYYEILKPYRDCEFDFIELASALDRACRQMQRLNADVKLSRYDFNRLEALYFDLKGIDEDNE